MTRALLLYATHWLIGNITGHAIVQPHKRRASTAVAAALDSKHQSRIIHFGLRFSKDVAVLREVQYENIY